MSIIIIAAQTATATSAPFGVTKYHNTKTVSANGLAGSEYVDVQIEHGTGVFISTGVDNRLTATKPVIALTGEGVYRLVKTVTTGAASAAVSS